MKVNFIWLRGEDLEKPQGFQEKAFAPLFVTIDHKEGAPPRAQIILEEDGGEKGLSGGMLFFEEDKTQVPLFVGKLVGPPQRGKGCTVVVELEARHPESHDQMESLKKELRVAPYFDPLFVEDEEDFEEILAGHTLSPHWDREGAFSFSDILQGSKEIALPREALAVSDLHQRIKKTPLGEIAVDISAEWVQEYTGVVNLSTSLLNTLPERALGTLTPETLQRAWWPSGYSLKGSGYSLLRSELKPLDLRTLPAFSRSFALEPSGEAHIPCAWFLPHMLLGFSYAQKRRERVCFSLTSNLGGFGQGQDFRKETLKIRLQNIREDKKTPLWLEGHAYGEGDLIQYQGDIYACVEAHESKGYFEERCWSRCFEDQSALSDQSSPTYFLKERGRCSIAHAMERAKRALTLGARVFEVSFETDFRWMKDLDCDTTLHLEDPRLPGGRIMGKVVHYAMTFKYGLQRVRVTLLSSIGGQEKGTFLERFEDWDLGNGILVEDPRMQVPSEGILEPQNLRGEDVLTWCRVVNDLEEQNALLEGRSFQTFEEVEQFLKPHSTRLTLGLLDLNGPETLEHTIQLRVLKPWSPPQHVIMKGDEG